MCMIIKEALENKGYPIFAPSCTNQVFVDLPCDVISKIETEFMVTHIKKLDLKHERIRIVTSWATQEEEATRFAKLIETL